MEEVWRPVKGYESLYEVSNLGRVRSLYWKEPRLMTITLDKDGYATVSLRNRENGRHCFHGKVHRMVAEAFIPNPQGYREINHKDEEKANNLVDNLEWCDCKYNINYGTRTQKVMAKLRNGPRSKAVIATLPDGTEEWYPSIREASRQLVSPKDHGARIAGVVNRRYGCNTAYGRKWRYAEVAVCNA